MPRKNKHAPFHKCPAVHDNALPTDGRPHSHAPSSITPASFIEAVNYRQLKDLRKNVTNSSVGHTEGHNYHLPGMGRRIIEASVLAERAAKLAFDAALGRSFCRRFPLANNAQHCRTR